MRIKRFISAFLLLTVLFTFCGCGVKQNIETDYTEETTSNVVRITFREGITARGIAEKLEKNGVCGAESFIAELNKTEYLELFGIDVASPGNRMYLLEGYLFPDTYDFYLGEKPSSVLKKFLVNMKSKFSIDVIQRCNELGLTTDELLTVASIVQRECGNGKDDGKVASVIFNRLENSPNARLQCDSTSFYLRENIKPYVDEEKYSFYVDLYSTYDTGGLPEGPINNCGMGAIKAVLYPEQTDYQFFVTDNSGNFYFSETYAEHLSNCTKAGIY